MLGDQIFIGSCNGIFRALNRLTGKISWEVDIRPEGDTDPFNFHGNPLITENKVIIGVDGITGGVYSFDRLTGDILWKYPAGRGVPCDIVSFGENIYAATMEGLLVCLDINSGQLRWSFPVKFPGFEGPIIVDGHVIAGGTDGNVYSLDSSTGNLLWKKALGSPITTSVIADESNLYLGTLKGEIYSIRGEDGTIISRFQVGSIPGGAPIKIMDELYFYLTDMKGNLYSLVCIDLVKKTERWRHKAIDSRFQSRLLVWKDCLVVGNSKGDVIAYDLLDGSERWLKKFKGNVRSIGHSDNTMYVATVEGILYAYVPDFAN